MGPDYHRPVDPASDVFASKTLVESTAAAVMQRWWEQFNDPLLNDLVMQTLSANRDLRAANAALAEARAQHKEGALDFLPGARSSAGRTKSLLAPFNQPGLTRDARKRDLYEVGFDAAWELDFFGAVRRRNEAARANAAALHAQRNATALSLMAEAARNYFELRGAQHQLEVARRNASYQKNALDLVTSRLDAGRGTALDTARAQAVYSTTLAGIPPLEAVVVRARNRIAVLTGQPPGNASPLLKSLATALPSPALPASIALGDPAELLRRRPDVSAAERQLAAATARVGVAVADLFPKVSFNGRVAFQSPSLRGVDDSGADYFSFGPSLTWAAFDLGRVRQRIKAADARAAGALDRYEQTVLLALEETDNALSDYGRERRRLANLRDAAAASQQAADLATQRFAAGVADFLTVLDAYRTALDADNQLAAGETRAGSLLIALYKALGGGWEILETPAAAQR